MLWLDFYPLCFTVFNTSPKGRGWWFDVGLEVKGWGGIWSKSRFSGWKWNRIRPFE